MLWNDRRTPPQVGTDTRTGQQQHLSVQMGAQYAAPKTSSAKQPYQHPMPKPPAKPALPAKKGIPSKKRAL